MKPSPSATTTRRAFVSTLAGAAVTLASAPGSSASVTGAPRAAAEARRRIIWNNDGDDLRFVAFGIRRLWTARDPDDLPLPDRFSSVQEFLDLRMSALRQSAVDTISYCGVFNWPAWEMPRDRIAALGADPIQPIVDFARKAGKEFFFNLRMNDCHSSLRFSGPAWWEPFRAGNPHLLQSKFSQEELKEKLLPWVRGEAAVSPVREVIERRGGGNRDVQSWSAYDYARPEVREYFLDLIRQVCARYDVDGIDLDWLRHPFFFRFGEERQKIPLMNDFVRRVAGVVRRAAKERGRNIVLAMRVPDTPERAREIGLDVTAWIEEGWMDVLIAGNGVTCFTAPTTPWIEAAAARRIPVYGCITRNAPGLNDPAALRGASHRLWASGVSGLYFFNHFIPEEYGSIEEAADRARLAGLTKTYLLDSSYTRSQNGTVVSGPLPLDFSTCAGETSHEMSLEVPEAPAEGRTPRISVQWRGEDVEICSRWMVNGCDAAFARRGSRAGELIYDGTGIVSGVNRLRVVVQPASNAASASLVLTAVRVTIERG